jgi:DnaJ family protein C protein 7
LLVASLCSLSLSRLGNLPARPLCRTLMKRIRALDALKEAGNEAFKAGRIADAIAKYSEAIEADQDDNETLRATLLSNRAAAHMKVSRVGGAN